MARSLGPGDLPTIAVAGAIAALGVRRATRAERPGRTSAADGANAPKRTGALPPELIMGLQAATRAAIVALNATVGLIQSVWAITACTYVIAGSATGTIDRVKRRIVGTLIGVPLGLAFLPLAATMPVVVWMLAALAMVVYAMALPERYDIACGAFAFTLIVTLAVAGEHSVSVLRARAWDTLLGGALGWPPNAAVSAARADVGAAAETLRSGPLVAHVTEFRY